MDGEEEPVSSWPPDGDTVSMGDEEEADSNHDNTATTQPGHKRPADGSSDQTERATGMSAAKRRCEAEPLAPPALVRWWKKEGRFLCEDNQLPESRSPATLLRHIVRKKEATAFMKQQLQRLQTLASPADAAAADVHAATASYHSLLGDHSQAVLCFSAGLQLDPENKEYKWHLAKAKKQQNILEIQQAKLRLCTGDPQALLMPQPLQVERRSADGLSFLEFFTQYAMTSTPVVITGLVDHMTKVPWTLNHVRKVAGGCTAVLKRPVAGSAEWARLEDAHTSTVADYIDSVSAGDCRDLYLFDWSLPQHCPLLAKELTIPKYFAGDFLQRTSPGSLYQDSWPSLFMAPGGLCSELHVDAFGSNFWMALFQGRKRWVFFKRQDAPLLYPSYASSMDPVFEADLSHPDFQKHPLLQLAQPRECILQPGELLFVPAGCPHRVENLETSVAISANYVDLSNLELVKQELQVNGYTDQRASDLYDQITSGQLPLTMSNAIEHTEYECFKQRWCGGCGSCFY